MEYHLCVVVGLCGWGSTSVQASVHTQSLIFYNTHIHIHTYIHTHTAKSLFAVMVFSQEELARELENARRLGLPSDWTLTLDVSEGGLSMIVSQSVS
jgi:hypothetical protein